MNYFTGWECGSVFLIKRECCGLDAGAIIVVGIWLVANGVSGIRAKSCAISLEDQVPLIT